METDERGDERMDTGSVHTSNGRNDHQDDRPLDDAAAAAASAASPVADKTSESPSFLQRIINAVNKHLELVFTAMTPLHSTPVADAFHLKIEHVVQPSQLHLLDNISSEKHNSYAFTSTDTSAALPGSYTRALTLSPKSVLIGRVTTIPPAQSIRPRRTYEICDLSFDHTSDEDQDNLANNMVALEYPFLSPNSASRPGSYGTLPLEFLAIAVLIGDFEYFKREDKVYMIPKGTLLSLSVDWDSLEVTGITCQVPRHAMDPVTVGLLALEQQYEPSFESFPPSSRLRSSSSSNRLFMTSTPSRPTGSIGRSIQLSPIKRSRQDDEYDDSGFGSSSMKASSSMDVSRDPNPFGLSGEDAERSAIFTRIGHSTARPSSSSSSLLSTSSPAVRPPSPPSQPVPPRQSLAPEARQPQPHASSSRNQRVRGTARARAGRQGQVPLTPEEVEQRQEAFKIRMLNVCREYVSMAEYAGLRGIETKGRLVIGKIDKIFGPFKCANTPSSFWEYTMHQGDRTEFVFKYYFRELVRDNDLAYQDLAFLNVGDIIAILGPLPPPVNDEESDIVSPDAAPSYVVQLNAEEDVTLDIKHRGATARARAIAAYQDLVRE